MDYELKDWEGGRRVLIDVLSRDLTGQQKIQENPLSV